jgi:molybdopterin-containing oxidoreductase family membrane subunit
MFSPTRIDVGVYVGTIGLFFTLFLLFAKFFPVINMAEVKSILKYGVDNGPTYGGPNTGAQASSRLASPAPYSTPGVPASAPVNYDKQND